MTRFLMTVTIGMALALASYGCGGGADRQEGAQDAGVGFASTTSPSPAQGMVDVAVRIAREIQASPDAADAILQRHGKTREEFEQLLYDIAADPDLSHLYNQALGR